MRTDRPAHGWVYRVAVGVVTMCMIMGVVGPATALTSPVDKSVDMVKDSSAETLKDGGAKSSTDEFELAFADGSRATRTFPAVESFIVEANGGTFEFGDGASTRVRIRNTDTGETVTVAPDTDGETYTVNRFSFNAWSVINREESVARIRQPRDVSGERFLRTDVSITGDLEMFVNDTFAPYQAQVVDESGTVLAETGAEVHGVDYQQPLVRYNGTHIAVERHPDIDEDWYATRSQFGTDEVEMTNDDGPIDIGELNAAVQDFVTGSIGINELNAVAQAFVTA